VRQVLVALGAHQAAAVGDEGWHGRDPHGPGALPVLIHSGLEAAFFQSVLCFLGIATDGFYDPQQHRQTGDIPSFGEICPENGMVKRLPKAALFGPFAQFLSPAAVIGHRALAEGQTKLVGGLFEVGQHLRYVDGPPGKKILKGAALLRCFRVKGKRRPAKVDVEFLLQSFNTPGNEIAPGSDVVGKDLHNVLFVHLDAP
jgi:hypothetical protein